MERAARLIRKSKQSSSLLSDEDITRAIWPEAVGRAIAAHTVRIKLVRAKLVVEVEDAIWQRQLYPLTAQIVACVRKVMGSDVVQDIEFRIAVPRRLPNRAESLNPVTLQTNVGNDEADQIQDPVLKKLYILSRKKATA